MALTPESRSPFEWDPTGIALVEALARSSRGPRRQGIFALWLTLRVALDLCMDPPLPERATRRRIAALERRISSLTLPPPLRRALAGAMDELKDTRPETAVRVLRRLTAPAGETLGQAVRDAVAQAALTAARTRKQKPTKSG
ncbi:MAG: hypothetical protein HKM89_02155 [Gemmatimonadales bacterium]|nr:hypothetical protein [Gemmatimonadales bacterium]